MIYCTILYLCERACEIDYLSTKIANFWFCYIIIKQQFTLPQENLHHYKEFNGLSSAAYGNGVISENITQCNLHSHGWFLQTRCHIYILWWHHSSKVPLSVYLCIYICERVAHDTYTTQVCTIYQACYYT